MSNFTFAIDSIQIADTRSAHEDTDYVSLTLKVGGAAATTQVQRIGNVNNGVHAVNLSFRNVAVNPTDAVVLNYLVVNAGSASTASVTSALMAIGNTFANGPANQSPQLGSALPGDGPWISTNLASIFHAGSCDGLVAAEQDHFSYNDLVAALSKPFSQSTYHMGPRTSGCNSRPSGYIVKWEMGVSVPDLTEGMLTLMQAETELQNAGLALGTTSGTGNKIISTTPIAGAPEPFGTPVNLRFGTSPGR
jgi:hypothetical protein